MYFSDPPPHVHVEYAEANAVVEISTGRLLGGTLPPRVLRLLREWLLKNKKTILENWRLASLDLPIKRIEGLE